MSLFASNYDIIFFGIIAFSAVLAFIRGGIVEILSLGTWFIAFWALHKFGTLLKAFIPNSISNDLLRNIIIFIIIFLLVAIAMAVIKKLLANFINTIGLGGLNYIVGIGFGIIRGIFACALLIIVIQMLDLDSSKSYAQAKLYPALSPVVNWIAKAIPESVKDIPKPPTGVLDLYK
jgi:membrane protein required for colicin V production